MMVKRGQDRDGDNVTEPLNTGTYRDEGELRAPFSHFSLLRVAVRLILSSKNLNKNTGLFHLVGMELATSAQPETISKLLPAYEGLGADDRARRN
jgi:hypothetical protein